jgi:integrase
MGVKVVPNRQGRLKLRIFWKGRDVAVSTRLRDDGPGGRTRRLVQAKATLIEERLRKGAELHRALLDVLGDCPPHLLPTRPAPAREIPSVEDHAEWWLDWIGSRERRSYVRRAAWYMRSIVIPYWGAMSLADVTQARLYAFQDEVLARKVTRLSEDTGEKELVPIKVKTAKNVVTGFFRAMIIEAMIRHHAPSPDPFPSEMRWPQRGDDDPEPPDPFTPAERDSILDHYYRHNRFWYPFLCFQFWTGARPSETAALRESDVDLRRGTVFIHRSRVEGAENKPKTRASKRTIHLYPNVLQVLRDARPTPAHAKPDDYFFVGSQGGPVYTRAWGEDYGFYSALTRLKIRKRKFYATRHTFISWALTQGGNAYGIAKYCGTSVEMIEKNYGKYMPDGGLDPRLIEAVSENATATKKSAVKGSSRSTATLRRARNRTQNRTQGELPFRPSMTSRRYGTEGVGFEPTRACALPIFKTGAFDRSATPPRQIF